jgi:site-specific DNA-cytosine methylase
MTRGSRYFTEFVAGEAETRAYRAGGGGGGRVGGGGGGGDLGPLSQPPRFYSARECARLQGFPEDFVLTWAGQRNPNRLYHQLGNAVSPATVELIAAAMLCARRFQPSRSILTEIYLCNTVLVTKY